MGGSGGGPAGFEGVLFLGCSNPSSSELSYKESELAACRVDTLGGFGGGPAFGVSARNWQSSLVWGEGTYPPEIGDSVTVHCTLFLCEDPVGLGFEGGVLAGRIPLSSSDEDELPKLWTGMTGVLQKDQD